MAFSVFILSQVSHTVYPALRVLLITSNNTKHNVCVCLCVGFQSKCVSAKTIMESQGEETTFQCRPFFAQCIKKRLRGRTIEEWMFSKQRLTLPAGQALIWSILTQHKPAVNSMLIVSVLSVYTKKNELCEYPVIIVERTHFCRSLETWVTVSSTHRKFVLNSGLGVAVCLIANGGMM